MCTSLLAIAVGMITLVGSLVAAGKLHRVLPQKPLIWPGHSVTTMIFLLLTIACIVAGAFSEGNEAMLHCLVFTFPCVLVGQICLLLYRY